jgi:hypothetical protein
MMPFRSPVALGRVILAGLALGAVATRAGAESEQGIGPFTGPEADAEAARLYHHADDFVRNVAEGRYSYAYMQFYWKRAGANIDRILRAYSSSPTAQKLRAGELQAGPFAPKYFKECVLPRLEEKKVAAFDAVNCAIFLHGLKSNNDEAGKKRLLEKIIETLCRQIRWNEALGFPVLDEERAWLWNIVVREAAIYHNDQLTDELLTNIFPEARPQLLASVAAGRAFRGDSPEELEQFLADNQDEPALRAAVFAGLARRELKIQRALSFKLPLKGLYDGVDGIQNPEQQADLASFLATIPAGPAHNDAVRHFAVFLAGLGRLDEARHLAPAAAGQPDFAAAYAEWLVLNEDYDRALDLARTLGLSPADAEQFHLRLIEILASASREKEAAAVRARLPARLAAEAAFREFHGRMFATGDSQLVVRENSFSDLPLEDPNLTGWLICEWSLTPNRTLRGAAPWDAVVFKFAPGFENLTPPTEKKKIDAAK